MANFRFQGLSVHPMVNLVPLSTFCANFQNHLFILTIPTSSDPYTNTPNFQLYPFHELPNLVPFFAFRTFLIRISKTISKSQFRRTKCGPNVIFQIPSPVRSRNAKLSTIKYFSISIHFPTHLFMSTLFPKPYHIIT